MLTGNVNKAVSDRTHIDIQIKQSKRKMNQSLTEQ
jgi:hypothetical protein